MNRIFTTVALQSTIAAAVIAMSPLASASMTAQADPGTDHVLVSTPFVSTVSREQVRAEAVAAARVPLTFTDSQNEPVRQAFVSTVSRAQVRAEAVEATRLGLSRGYEGNQFATPEQLTQIRNAGLRAASPELSAAKR